MAGEVTTARESFVNPMNGLSRSQRIVANDFHLSPRTASYYRGQSESDIGRFGWARDGAVDAIHRRAGALYQRATNETQRNRVMNALSNEIKRINWGTSSRRGAAQYR